MADRPPPPQSIPEPIQVDSENFSNNLYADHVPQPLVPSNPDDSDDEEDMGEIKAALPEEYSGNVEDARRWLLAMEGYFALHDRFGTDEAAKKYTLLNRMSKGRGKAFSEGWHIKLTDEMVPDSQKTYAKIKEAFMITFSPYNTKETARSEMSRIRQSHKEKGFDDYLSEFSLLAVRSGITDRGALTEWFLQGVSEKIANQLSMSGILKTATTMEEIYNKAAQIDAGLRRIHGLKKGPLVAYGGGGHRDPNAMDVD